MFPTNPLVAAVASAVAGDTAALGAATALQVHLIISDFTPGPTTSLASLSEATFTGSAPKAAGAAPQTVGNDPTTGRRKILLKEPAGGWNWICTVPAAADETVYGIVVTDTTNAVTWGSTRLPNPVTVHAAGDIVSVGEVALLLAEVPFD